MNPSIFVTHPNGRERINVAYYPCIQIDGDEISFSSSITATYWFFSSAEEAEQCFKNIAYTLVNVYSATFINDTVVLPEEIRSAGVYEDEDGWFISLYITTFGEALRFDFASEQQAIDAFHQIYQRL